MIVLINKYIFVQKVKTGGKMNKKNIIKQCLFILICIITAFCINNNEASASQSGIAKSKKGISEYIKRSIQADADYLTSASRSVTSDSNIIYINSTKKVGIRVNEIRFIRLKGKYKKVKYTTTNSSIVGVNSKGKLRAKRPGRVTIKVKAGKKVFKCVIYSYCSQLNYAILTGSYSNLGSKDKKIARKVHTIINKKIDKSWSKIRKVRYIHDYLINNCEYDYDNYLKGTLPSSSYTAEGVFLKKRAVCSGYANAFKLFMDGLGIENNLIFSAAHEWNQIKLYGIWCHIDCSWDDPVWTDKSAESRISQGYLYYLQYKYFMVDDSILKTDNTGAHTFNTSRFKKCRNKKFQYYAFNMHLGMPFCDGQDYAFNNIVGKINSGKRKINILLRQDLDPGKLVNDLCWRYGGKISYFYNARVGNYYIFSISLS
ncbi:Ig-like domain (group 2) [Acetitomaculum ruminis DSM 5522]|uniref:Ig-like domain (Group 2) n=1 Tax=Acetitomaculum ruminis DSM 5522 TaxID=1120918 RepID=A0A1I0V2T2_9FIRM|nr:transglutaminase domain-containing protein [Acetitomaculum ruminis]SFA70625.1 Ig-like domain (group 2) [Acetitomaculum ruminis DSM 5522]